MSSIYRKSRDGYFYYQTYLYNPKSNKKDKKVFHSLKTKEESIALQKKKVYDNKYNKNNLGAKNRKKIFYPKMKWIIFPLFVISLIYNVLINNKNQALNSIIKKKNNELPSNLDFNNSILSKVIEPNIRSENIPATNRTNVVLNSDDENLNQNETKFLEYTIERVEGLKSAFKLGKIYATIDANTDSLGQLNICKEIATDYKDFTNIIICLYLNDPICKELASVERKEASSNNLKECWIGMYTYNKVEGEYFDNNPVEYLSFMK
jgi:hypothetical protein